MFLQFQFCVVRRFRSGRGGDRSRASVPPSLSIVIGLSPGPLPSLL